MFWNAVNERHEEVNNEAPLATGKKELAAQETETESVGTTPDLPTIGKTAMPATRLGFNFQYRFPTWQCLQRG